MRTLINTRKESLDLPKIIDEINVSWVEEKAKRENFYKLTHKDIWVACTNISAYLTVYVK